MAYKCNKLLQKTLYIGEHNSREEKITPMEQAGKKRARVLIISDELNTAAIWGYSLSQVEIDVKLIGPNENVLEVWDTEIPDITIIEDFDDQVEMLAVCQKLRAITISPILYFTSRISENDHLKIYQAGADECIPYPITPRIFQAKVGAWLRRTRSLPLAALDEIQVGGFVLDPTLKQITLPGGKRVNLTLLETRLLYFLMNHAGRVIPKDELIERVWGHSNEFDRRLLKNHIYRLRRKIEPNPSSPRYLINVGYSGYEFLTSEQTSTPSIPLETD